MAGKTTTTVTYYLFGLPIWRRTVITDTQVDEEALYDRMAQRFNKEITEALAARGR